MTVASSLDAWVIAASAGVFTAMLFAGAARLATAPRQRVRGRLASLQDHSTYIAESQVELLRSRRSRFPLFDLILRGHTGDDMRQVLDRAGLDLRVGEYLALRLLSVIIALVLLASVAAAIGADGRVQLLLLVSGGLVGALLPGILVHRRIAKRRAAVDRELVEMCDLMASMLQSGFGYLQALNAVAEQLEQPLAGELARMRDQIRLGAGVDDALLQMNERLSSPDFDMVATAILIQRQSGGSLAGILSGVAKTVRDRHLFRAEVSALTSRERFSGVVLAGFPLLLGLILTLMLPETFGRLFTDPAGRVIFAIALALDVIGYLAIKRATRLEV